ncbi:MAG: hypothetical protein ABL961_17015 [Vicinamibacterales bacterium]
MSRIATDAGAGNADGVTTWKPATLVAFRFVFLYVVLWSLANQVVAGMFLTPVGQLPPLGPEWPMRAITGVLGELFTGHEVRFEGGNSGDTLFHWVQTSWLLALSLFGTLVWSAADRGRTNYAELHKWFRLFLRFALCAQMFYYGMAKVIPTQFVPPALTVIVQPIGNLSLSNLLWAFVGASVPYQVFGGVAEVVGAVLLVFPRTTPLGALVTLADMVQVLALNAGYDFGLKQISSHYILMSLLVLAPDARRLLDVLVLDRPAPPSTHRPLASRPDRARVVLVAQVLFGAYLFGVYTWLQVRQWEQPDGPAHPRSALYGIWDVERMTVDGEERHPATNDYDRRWRRAIFDFPDRMVFQRFDDSMARYDSIIDVNRGTLLLRKGTTGMWATTFEFERPAEDRLVLNGVMDGHAIHAELSLVGRDTWRLVNSPFRWVRPPE